MLAIPRSLRTSVVLPIVVLWLCSTASAAFAVAVSVLWDQQCAVTEPVCILVVPDGSGGSFAEARTIGGEVVDATIAVLLWGIDEYGPLGPVFRYPADDLTLVPVEDQTQGCEHDAVAIADDATGPDGWTTFSLPQRSGGWSQSPLRVALGGSINYYYCECPQLPIYFNSPDIDGSGRVDLTDVTIFAQDLHAGDAAFRSDFRWDGVLDLADVVIFTQHVGAGCE